MNLISDPSASYNQDEELTNYSSSSAEQFKNQEITVPEKELHIVSSDILRATPLVIINRENPTIFQSLSSALDFNLGSTIAGTLRLKNIESEAHYLLKKLKATPEQRELLVGEIKWQSELMARAEGVDKIKVLIEFVLPIRNQYLISSDGFHVDAAHRRILCTYLGPGTEWIRSDSIEPSILKNKISIGMAKVISSPNWMLPESEILQIPTGEVVIAKSNEWIHRRPYTKQSRLFMTIDPA